MTATPCDSTAFRWPFATLPVGNRAFNTPGNPFLVCDGLERSAFLCRVGSGFIYKQYTFYRCIPPRKCIHTRSTDLSGTHWCVLIGYLAFGEIPDIPTILGAGFIVLAGLLLLQRQDGQSS